jgi:uncharacterized membrane protein YkvA (DUF1232 family)
LRKKLKPYKEQFKRSPLWVKIVASLCIGWLLLPIDPWDILFPWIAFHDDLFIAGILLKLLHKYGSLPDEELTKPIDLLKDIFKKSEGIKKNHNH